NEKIVFIHGKESTNEEEILVPMPSTLHPKKKKEKNANVSNTQNNDKNSQSSEMDIDENKSQIISEKLSDNYSDNEMPNSQEI
ncbi:35717_t:CDS:2, partial [Gigaspora margarita]